MHGDNYQKAAYTIRIVLAETYGKQRGDTEKSERAEGELVHRRRKKEGE